ncbi:4636_t:CDS:2, partial [Scutellospora calospora]
MQSCEYVAVNSSPDNRKKCRVQKFDQRVAKRLITFRSFLTFA